ncbi:GNAT family N-acetyltransferase [Cryobacterium adonitolivorans]|uniref:GNAT family N-acetyltransferase n=1 Tax=Cryobacterium adonitolivorans TaxID=1259189 RepID=A0A4R8W8J9_9MICO|nr:GNAT family N-acetyltransferase [Cryobacterium adonitolivorans]TFC04066.1 GNAT family N-acetyltransferase [Cryobacterium adonitolivorans]
MDIREAREGDWGQIWPFLRDVVAAGETYCWPRDTTEDAARAWWMGKPGGRVFVADDNGRVLGTAELHTNQPAAGGHVCNAGFMVAPQAAGRGIGRALAEYVLAQAANAGFRAMQFNAVVETNHNAVSLWQSLGFSILTTVPGAFRHPAHGFVGLHVMHRSLLPQHPSPIVHPTALG